MDEPHKPTPGLHPDASIPLNGFRQPHQREPEEERDSIAARESRPPEKQSRATAAAANPDTETSPPFAKDKEENKTHRGTASARTTEGANAETRLEETYPPSILAGDDAVAVTAAGEAKRKP